MRDPLRHEPVPCGADVRSGRPLRRLGVRGADLSRRSVLPCRHVRRRVRRCRVSDRSDVLHGRLRGHDVDLAGCGDGHGRGRGTGRGRRPGLRCRECRGPGWGAGVAPFQQSGLRLPSTGRLGPRGPSAARPRGAHPARRPADPSPPSLRARRLLRGRRGVPGRARWSGTGRRSCPRRRRGGSRAGSSRRRSAR